MEIDLSRTESKSRNETKNKMAEYATTNFVFQVAPKAESKREKEKEGEKRERNAGELNSRA
jgi:hypothetical protein